MGGVRTALFNRLFSERNSGVFILRIEDTDIERSRPEYERAITEDLAWLGLDPDEGPDRGGEKGPYRQSERLSLYREHAERLLSENRAYRCYCTPESLEGLKSTQTKSGLPPRYDGRCRDLAPGKAPEGVEPVIRFKVPGGEGGTGGPGEKIDFVDLVHGALSFDTRSFGDFVIVASDRIASYNFAVVVDDALMDITHVIRGDDHLSNTPRQILLYRALGFTPPVYCHLPLILAPDKTPLSKRHGSATVIALREEGFLPEAILNAAARLGWSPGEEFMTLKEMAGKFSTERLSKSPSVFDMERLRSFNRSALERLDIDTIIRLIEAPDDVDRAYLEEVMEAVRTNAGTIKDLRALAEPFIGPVKISEEARSILIEPASKKALKAFFDEVEKMDDLDENSYNALVTKVKSITGAKGKALFMPLRCALTGETSGIELAKILGLLGKKKVLERLGGTFL